MARIDRLPPYQPIGIAKAGDKANAYQISAAQGNALRNLSVGTATDHEQIEAFNTIVNVICLKDVSAYRQTDRDSNFALGRQWVGQQLSRLVTYPLEILQQKEDT